VPLLDTRAGIDLPVHKRRVGYVFQDGRLFPHLNVRQNLTYGRWFAPAGSAAQLDHITELLGIGALLNRMPSGLSGGEKQRVAIGRALLSAPRLLLMDEPLAALDEARKAEIMPYLERLRDETRIPILYVSHSVSEVARLATTVVAIDAGRVVRAGPAAEVLADPEAVPAIGVRQAGAILSATVVRHDDDGLSELQVSGGRLFLPRVDAGAGATIRLRILAQDVILATEKPRNISALNVLPAVVTSIRQGQGPGVAISVQCGDDMLLARITRRSATGLGLRTGSACFIVLKSVAVSRVDVGTHT
jgi:molybdate transport system ATP-binding protein